MFVCLYCFDLFCFVVVVVVVVVVFFFGFVCSNVTELCNLSCNVLRPIRANMLLFRPMRRLVFDFISRLAPIARFSALGAGCTLSRAWHRFLVLVSSFDWLIMFLSLARFY